MIKVIDINRPLATARLLGKCSCTMASITGVSIEKLSRELWPYLLGIFMVLLLMAYIPPLCLAIPDLLMPR